MQNKKGIRTFQIDALLQLQTNVESEMCIAKLKILTFGAPDAGSCDSFHPKFDAGNKLLVIHSASNKEVAYAPIDLTTLA